MAKMLLQFFAVVAVAWWCQGTVLFPTPLSDPFQLARAPDTEAVNEVIKEILEHAEEVVEKLIDDDVVVAPDDDLDDILEADDADADAEDDDDDVDSPEVNEDVVEHLMEPDDDAAAEGVEVVKEALEKVSEALEPVREALQALGADD